MLSGGSVLTGEPAFRRLDLVIDGPRIVDVVEAGQARSRRDGDLDATGLLVTPGFIDLQINGGWGADLTARPETVGWLAERLPGTGVTAFCPTIITSPPSTRRTALDHLGQMSRTGGASATVLGLHLEGPIINPERAGAHDRAHIPSGVPPDAGQWSRTNGVAMVTLAPEADGALDLIPALVSRGVTVALGHTEAAPEIIGRAVERGATVATHLFNAMMPLDHHRPGAVASILDCDDLWASIICDGLHVHPMVVSLAWKILGPHRTILVSDATAALGDRSGEQTTLAGRPVTLAGGAPRTAEGRLAGSVLSLGQAIRNLVEFTGASPAEVLQTVTTNPARALGLADRGRIAPGAVADVTLLSPDLRVVGVVIGGRRV